MLGLRYRIPILHRVAAPIGALLVLNAAAVVGFYKFLFTPGPLWKIWNSPKPVGASPKSGSMTPVEPTVGAAIDTGKAS